jgi:hypothetical protein
MKLGAENSEQALKTGLGSLFIYASICCLKLRHETEQYILLTGKNESLEYLL